MVHMNLRQFKQSCAVRVGLHCFQYLSQVAATPSYLKSDDTNEYVGNVAVTNSRPCTWHLPCVALHIGGINTLHKRADDLNGAFSAFQLVPYLLVVRYLCPVLFIYGSFTVYGSCTSNGPCTAYGS